MKPVDVFLAVLIAVIWGLAFVASRLALDELSPQLMTAMRFAIAALPCLLVRRPNVPWTVLIGGTVGIWLLDPTDVTINTTGTANISGASPFDPTAGGSIIGRLQQ